MLLTLVITAVPILSPIDAFAYSSETEVTSQYVMVDAQTGETEIIDLPDNSSNSMQNFISEASFSIDETGLLNKVGNSNYSILGWDSRVKVNNASVLPYRAIARLDITRQDGSKTYASGALIGDRLFATAAHAIVKDGKLPKALTLEFGRNGSEVYYTTNDVKTYILKSNYITNPTDTGDYAFVVLNNGIGDITGYFGIESSISVGTTIYTAGYPQDKGGKDVYLSQGTVVNVEENKVYYDADTDYGQSGSPVFLIKNGKPHIIAIHTHGTNTPDATDACNGGRRLNSSLCYWLESNGYLD